MEKRSAQAEDGFDCKRIKAFGSILDV